MVLLYPRSRSNSLSTLESISADKINLNKEKEKNNKSTFILMVINTVFEVEHWDSSIHLLDTLVQCNPKSSQSVLMSIFLQVIRVTLKTDIIELVIKFISKVCGKNGEVNRDVELFLI